MYWSKTALFALTAILSTNRSSAVADKFGDTLGPDSEDPDRSLSITATWPEENDQNLSTSAVGWQLYTERDVYFWAIGAVELYASSDCATDSRISTASGATFFDSGHRADQGPDRAFRGLRWPGRKDAEGVFYLGVEFDSPKPVQCIRIFQFGGGAEDVKILSKETSTSDWSEVHHATNLSGGWSTISISNENEPSSTATGASPTLPTTSSATTSATTTSSVAAPSTVQSMANPIQVPSDLVPSAPGANQHSSEIFCRYLDLSSVVPPPNPGYKTESFGPNTVLSGDDIWITSFYMMLYANCERQARGLSLFSMWSNDIMLELQPTYVHKSGHAGFGERTVIIKTAAAEGAGGGPVINGMRCQ